MGTYYVYVGERNDARQMHGIGRLTYANGNVYEGSFVLDKPNGNGVLSLRNENGIYEGEFVNGLRYGTGKYVCPSYVYEGSWVNDQKNGPGRIIYTELNETYDGEWFEDQKSGVGRYTYPDGSFYIGSYKDNQRQGQGKFNFTNGDIFAGIYTNDKISFGKLTFNHENDFYEGEFMDNKFHGKGRLTRKVNGYEYIGEFENGLKNGIGRLIYGSGDIYQGNFSNDNMNGYGVFYLVNGDHYEGLFKNNLYHGQGKYFWKKLNYYWEGTFANGKKDLGCRVKSPSKVKVKNNDPVENLNEVVSKAIIHDVLSTESPLQNLSSLDMSIDVTPPTKFTMNQWFHLRDLLWLFGYPCRNLKEKIKKSPNGTKTFYYKDKRFLPFKFAVLMNSVQKNYVSNLDKIVAFSGQIGECFVKYMICDDSVLRCYKTLPFQQSSVTTNNHFKKKFSHDVLNALNNLQGKKVSNNVNFKRMLVEAIYLLGSNLLCNHIQREYHKAWSKTYKWYMVLREETEVDKWLKQVNLSQYSFYFRKLGANKIADLAADCKNETLLTIEKVLPDCTKVIKNLHLRKFMREIKQAI